MSVTKGDVKTGLIVITSIFIAGYLMNMLRDNEHVYKSISGFDA